MAADGIGAGPLPPAMAGNWGIPAQAQHTRGPRACDHIAIYHSPAYVFIIAMPLQPSFRRKPESSVVISYYGNGGGKHRFRRKPE